MTLEQQANNPRCIEWKGRKHAAGYGLAAYGVPAHRWAHEVFIGRIPPGLLVMHTCDNPPCVNPLHLRAATQAENMADCAAKGRARNHHTDKPACLRGHLFDEKNTYIRTKDGVAFGRACRACRRVHDRTYRAS